MSDLNTRQLAWWGLTAVYIGLIYATLGDMPAYWRQLNRALSGHGIVFQCVLYATVGIAVLVFLNRRGFLARSLHLAVTAVFIAAFAVMFYLEKNPGEKIHMLQYGIFGWLVYKSFSLHFDYDAPLLYLAAGALVFAAGAIDEVIQGMLPNRYFTLHDVFINGLSGILVQLYIWFYFARRRAPGPLTENNVS